MATRFGYPEQLRCSFVFVLKEHHSKLRHHAVKRVVFEGQLFGRAQDPFYTGFNFGGGRNHSWSGVKADDSPAGA